MVGLVVAGALAASAGTAAMVVPAASACSDAAHCYAVVQQNDGGSPQHGMWSQIRTNCMNGATAARFMTHEMWAVTTNGQRWVETGTVRGAQYGTDTIKSFWARNDPGLSPSFGWKILGNAPFNAYTVYYQLFQPAVSKWWIYNSANDTFDATSALTTAVGLLQAGAETNSDYTNSYGSINYLQTLSPSRTWSNGLPGGGAVTRHAGMGFMWTDAPWSYRVSAGNISC